VSPKLAEQPGEASDEGLGRLVEVLPVRIGGQHGEVGQRANRVPVADAVRPVGQREQADRVLRTARCDVDEHLTEEFHD